MAETLPPTLQNVLDQKTLKWIFCGMSINLCTHRAAPSTHIVSLLVYRWKGRRRYVSTLWNCTTARTLHLGKTTTSCSLAIQLSKVRQSVLIIVRLLPCHIAVRLITCRIYTAYSRLIPRTTSRMRSGKSSPKKQRRLTALIISLRWKSTRRAPYKRWLTNVRLGFSFFPPSGPPLLGVRLLTGNSQRTRTA